MDISITDLRHWISYLLQSSLMILVFAWSIRHLFRTGHFLSSVMRLWIGLIGWGIFLCLLLPWFIFSVTHDRHTFAFFPETPGVVALVMIGWLPSLLYCSVAYFIRALWLRWQKFKTSSP